MKKPFHFIHTPVLAVSVLVLFYAHPLYSQTTTTVPPTSTQALLQDLKDPDENWTLGFSRLSTDSDASSDVKALALTLPRIWRQAFGNDFQHRLSDKEKEGIRQTLLDQAENKTRVSISQAIDDRDKLWLAETIDVTKDAAAAVTIKAARDKLAAQLSVSPDVIPVADQKKIVLAEASADQSLFEPVAKAAGPSAEILATTQKLQALVFGSITENAGYVFIKIWAWNSYEKRIVWEYGTALRLDEAESLAEEQIEEMAAVILGRPTGGVTVRAQPPGTLITLKPQNTEIGMRHEIGAARFRFLDKGDYTVSLQADGYVPRAELITVVAGKDQDLNYKLDPAQVSFVTIDSVPSGASVYLYSRFQGTTPVKIPLPKTKTEVFLELEGYQRYQLTVFPDNPGPLLVPLMKDILNWNNEMKLRRDRFYDSLGLFGLSILPPLILNGLVQNILGSLGKDPSVTGVSSDYYQQQATQANVYYHLSLGALVLTGVAFVDMALNLARYLEAADFASGRHD